MLRLGTKTQWGTVQAVLWLSERDGERVWGERYYHIVGWDGSVAMMPAATVEDVAGRPQGSW